MVATRLAQFDSLVDDLADYMSRERASAGDEVAGSKFITRDLREALGGAVGQSAVRSDG